MSSDASAVKTRQRQSRIGLDRFKEKCAEFLGISTVDVAALDPVDMTRLHAGENADKTAVVICHGMGQQVRWQTLADLIDAFRQRSGITVLGTRLARFLDDDHKELILGRVEVAVKDAQGQLRELHLYEAYWAPLTEGRVQIRDVVGFLWDAGFRGIRHTFTPFVRYMFKQARTFPSTPFVAIPLACALAIFAALVSLNAAIATVTTAGVLKWSQSADARSMVTLYVGAVEVMALAYLLVTFGVAAYRTRRRRADSTYHVSPLIQSLLFLLLSVLGLVTIVAGVLVWWPAARDAIGVIQLPQVVTIVVWGFAIWLAARTRGVLVQYVGDVVVYVSAFQVSRFEEIRDKIQGTGRRVLCTLYASGGYGSHLVVGHSLGSVVAYDALNAAIARDRWQPKSKMHVVERTRAFITFGSPLDKIAFIFRSQSRDGSVREALSSQAQPLIDNPSRPPWINIYSPQDPISGSLDFFDDPSNPRLNVTNIRDHQADLPLWAHTQYWGNDVLVREILGALPQQQKT